MAISKRSLELNVVEGLVESFRARYGDVKVYVQSLTVKYEDSNGIAVLIKGSDRDSMLFTFYVLKPSRRSGSRYIYYVPRSGRISMHSKLYSIAMTEVFRDRLFYVLPAIADYQELADSVPNVFDRLAFIEISKLSPNAKRIEFDYDKRKVMVDGESIDVRTLEDVASINDGIALEIFKHSLSTSYIVGSRWICRALIAVLLSR